MQKNNLALCNEIADIILSVDIPVWQIADLFEVSPDMLIYMLRHGKIKPTVFQLIMFMDTTNRPLNKICISDYK